MERTVNIREAQSHLSQLLAQVERGERVVITRAGQPIAVLAPIPLTESEARTGKTARIQPRVPGRDKGKIIIHPNLDDPLS